MNKFYKKILFFFNNNPNKTFFMLFIGIAFYYNYNKILFYRPQSIHMWRQTECTSFARNFYQKDMNFFHPQVLNTSSDNGKTAYGVSESPIFYYILALLYKIFGFHEFFHRLVNVIIFYIGLFALFKLISKFLNDKFWGITLSLLFFTSPVLVYYANNFLMDITALSLVFVGCYYVFKYYQSQNVKQFVFAMIFFTIAALLKITSAMTPLILLGFFVLELFKPIELLKNKKFFPTKIIPLLCFSVFFLIVASWYLFAVKYNYSHHSYLAYSTKTWPIWKLSEYNTSVKQVIDSVKEFWIFEYFNIYVLYFFAAIILFILIFLKKTNRFLGSFFLVLTIGIFLYVILWFYVFKDHDYYTINLYILFVVLLLIFIDILNNNFYKVLKSSISKILFTLFLIYNIYYAHQHLKERYKPTYWANNTYFQYKALGEIETYLRYLGIQQNDKVISIPDGTPNYSLYLMNVRGFTEFNGIKDSTSIANCIDLGAKYLIINKMEYLEKDYIKPFTKLKIGQYYNVSIFSL